MSHTDVAQETSKTAREPAVRVEFDIPELVNSTAVGMFVVDAGGHLVAANATGLLLVRAFQIDQPRSSTQPLTVRLMDGSTVRSSCMGLQRVLAGERTVHELQILEHDDGDRTILRVSASPILSRAGTTIGAVGVAVDVTVEYELAEARDEFIRTAAHELKTPLAVIKANADAALHSLPGAPEAVRQPLDGMSRGVDRIDRLVGSLLDLLDIEGGLYSFTRIAVRLDELVARMISRLPERAAARVHLETSRPTVIQCDEARLRRALLSIVDNALKYSPKATPIEVSVRSFDDTAVVEIRDHGFGIPADKRARIFEKYFRAHAGTAVDTGGIGVGLFVAHAIITQHGGRIWCESVENQGTTFFVQLPLDRSAG